LVVPIAHSGNHPTEAKNHCGQNPMPTSVKTISTLYGTTTGSSEYSECYWVLQVLQYQSTGTEYAPLYRVSTVLYLVPGTSTIIQMD
jgi:hypothetical protein